ncbi:MAG: hypothetical protein ACREDC_03390 [Bradyrhizobium sp.]
MQDMKAHLEKLQVQMAECEMIARLATDKAKRDLFTRLAGHYKVLAAEVARAIAARGGC